MLPIVKEALQTELKVQRTRGIKCLDTVDGFTGFTPVQMRVIGALMERCSEMIVTLECSEGEDVRVPVTEDELFYLSHKTASDRISISPCISSSVKRELLQRENIQAPCISWR